MCLFLSYLKLGCSTFFCLVNQSMLLAGSDEDYVILYLFHLFFVFRFSSYIHLVHEAWGGGGST
jgi:hypothetical protein